MMPLSLWIERERSYSTSQNKKVTVVIAHNLYTHTSKGFELKVSESIFD